MKKYCTGIASLALAGLLTGCGLMSDQSDEGQDQGPGNTIGEYTTSGQTINSSLISGLYNPQGIAISGKDDLFVANNGFSMSGPGSVGKYRTSGKTINASLISQLWVPYAIAVSGNDVFITNPNDGTNGLVGEYTTSGKLVNASLISGLWLPLSIAASGTNLFVAKARFNSAECTIGKYTTSGATVDASLISGLSRPDAMAISGTNLFVVTVTSFGSVNGTNDGVAALGEYTTSGKLVNASLISNLTGLFAIAGTNLFVVNAKNRTIDQYTTSGKLVSASLISGLRDPGAIAVSGTNLFVASRGPEKFYLEKGRAALIARWP